MSQPSKSKHTTGQTQQKSASSRPLQYRPRPPKSTPKPIQTPAYSRSRRIPFILAGVTVFGISCYGVLVYTSLSRLPPAQTVPADVSDRYDENAASFDSDVNTIEKLAGINKRRKELTKLAKGDILEVSVGTGRNIPYYPLKECKSITMVDQSSPMLAIAKKKWKDEHPDYSRRIFFRNQSALDPIPSPSPEGFDAVIQTMGLCSTPEPEALLRNLGAVTKKDGGQILLLEHGKSHYKWLNDYLDKTAPMHADKHGCWWNKDIGKIVEDSGLEVVKIKRYNFGTTWWVELKPQKGMKKEASPTEEVVAQEVVPQVVQKRWWGVWS